MGRLRGGELEIPARRKGWRGGGERRKEPCALGLRERLWVIYRSGRLGWDEGVME